MEIPADTWPPRGKKKKNLLDFFNSEKAEEKLGSVKEVILLKIHVHLDSKQENCAAFYRKIQPLVKQNKIIFKKSGIIQCPIYIVYLLDSIMRVC